MMDGYCIRDSLRYGDCRPFLKKLCLLFEVNKVYLMAGKMLPAYGVGRRLLLNS
jgi:hypothetical protein